MSWSQISSPPAATADQARIFIQLSNGMRFIVPVAQTATIAELHAKAVQRATTYGFERSLQDSFLQTTGALPVALHGEDEVATILDLIENNTLDLCESLPQPMPIRTKNSLDNSGTSNRFMSQPQFASTTKDTIYVRWVDLDSALSAAQLIAVKVDHVAYLRSMTVAGLHKVATEKFVQTIDPTSSTLSSQQVRLFLKEGLLNAKDESTTLGELGVVGTKSDALDVFVDVCPSNVLGSVKDFCADKEADSLWGFPSTKRGIATFVTTLKMVIHELGAGTIDGFLEVLFEITHFPPLLLAFRYLFENNMEDPEYAQHLRMLAHACNILCLQIVPASICQSPNRALESSRQLLTWIYQSQSNIELN